jgi:hypothetical protein
MNGPEVGHVPHPVDVLGHDGQALVLHQSEAGDARQVARPDKVVKHLLQGNCLGQANGHGLGKVFVINNSNVSGAISDEAGVSL